MPLMIFLINLRSYPIRIVLLHPHDLDPNRVLILIHQYPHRSHRHHHHHHHHQKLYPLTASPSVARVISKFLNNTTNTVIINATSVTTAIPSSDSSWSRSI
ncbi:hypothetical protein CMV_008778 [Castanea mollissima]|uniref:Uncharacterized protein n=1 Tax=Castanea mollissima TaxID=60419 RepID=A0A8J4RPV5_9ROSI|nr:hypothetical protein CMV_008778 [Castanea mollissima]